MTSVLSATDALSRERRSLEDIQFNYPSAGTDWQTKYNEVVDMLAETRAELDDFHHASKELEAELENELQRTEKAQQQLRVKVERAEADREEWKAKFMSLQTMHNTTTTSLQRELDKLRQEHQQTKIQLRELEMGNDDLERTERAVSSSLADMETKYSRALEEKILLEQELIEKANLEEETQRLKDELRDANSEVSILKDQLAALQTVEKTKPTIQPALRHLTIPSDEYLLDTAPPPDLQLSELSPSSENVPNINTTPKAASSSSSTGHNALLHKAGFQPGKSTSVGSPSGIARSSTLHSLYNSSPRTPTTTARPSAITRNSSILSTSSTSTTAKNKGVQMVSEMRARVRNLEQKIHTRVPRLRMGSLTGRPNPSNAAPAMSATSSATGSSSSSSNGSTAKTSFESLAFRRSAESRQSNDNDFDSKGDTKGDSSGWVLIMEDSPSPQKVKEKEKERKDRRRISSPTAPTAFRPAASTAARAPSPSLSTGLSNSSLAQSTMKTGLRRPQSRLSGGSLSTTTSTSSIPTPVSRPATPTFLPLPTNSIYTAGLKRSIGPGGPNSYSQPKRSSLGMSTARSGSSLSDGVRERPTTMPPQSRTDTPSSTASSKYASEDYKLLPPLPKHNGNVTVRAQSKSYTNPLAQSRIGRPSTGRKSAGDTNILVDAKEARPRAGSSTAS